MLPPHKEIWVRQHLAKQDGPSQFIWLMKVDRALQLKTLTPHALNEKHQHINS